MEEPSTAAYRTTRLVLIDEPLRRDEACVVLGFQDIEGMKQRAAFARGLDLHSFVKVATPAAGNAECDVGWPRSP